MLREVARLGRQLVRQSGRDLVDLVAIGVGVPTPVDQGESRPLDSLAVPGWGGYDVEAALRRSLKAPVLLDKSANLMALGSKTAAQAGSDNLTFIRVGASLDAGTLLDGQVNHGERGVAGDIGHFWTARQGNVTCECGRLDCLNSVASGRAVAASLASAGLKASDTADVVRLVRSGSAAAAEAVREAGRALGEVLSAWVHLVNPSVIVIGGPLAEAGEYLLAGVREVVYARVSPLSGKNLTIVGEPDSGRAAVYGASARAVRSALAVDAVAAWLSIGTSDTAGRLQ